MVSLTKIMKKVLFFSTTFFNNVKEIDFVDLKLF